MKAMATTIHPKDLSCLDENRFTTTQMLKYLYAFLNFWIWHLSRFI